MNDRRQLLKLLSTLPGWVLFLTNKMIGQTQNLINLVWMMPIGNLTPQQYSIVQILDAPRH
jgi:hypothetical protein